MTASATDLRALFAASGDAEAARVIAYLRMGEFGRVRHHRDGRVYIEFPRTVGEPRRLWAIWAGETRVPLDERTATRILERIRYEMARGRGAREVLTEFLPRFARPNLVEVRLERWLAARRRDAEAGDLSPRTLSELERWCGSAGHFGWWHGRSIYEVSPATLDDWSAWLATERRLAPKTRWNILAGFHQFLSWLYVREELREMPRRYPWPRVPEHAPRLLSQDSQRAVLEAIAEDRRGIFLALALMGLRPSEALALRGTDYRDGWLMVARARKGRLVGSPERGTKTGRVKRLPVPDELAAWIERWVPAARRLVGGHLFEPPYRGRGRRPRGGWSETQLRVTWYAACDRAGVPRVGLYEGTKHSMATDAIRRGVSERALQAFLGHVDVRSTRRYARLSDGALVDVLPRRDRPS